MLEALGNSPEAAKKFFADPPTAYKKVEELTDEERMAIFSAGEALAEAPMEEFLGRHVLDPANSTFAQDLRESMLIGYGVGNDRENQQGNDPETG